MNRCELSELYENQCHHCVTGARDLGPQPTVFLEVYGDDLDGE